MRNYLRSMRENQPDWLTAFHSGDAFPRDEFFASRIVFYPGSGKDGHPVQLFGSTHSVHCFVYADYGVPRESLENALQDHGFRGYTTLARIELSEHSLTPNGWASHASDTVRRTAQGNGSIAPFGFFEVLERVHGLEDSHGADRLAVLFLGADGIATYDALFCQNAAIRPFAVVLQDHGFGGNYDRFGQGGQMEDIANRCNVRPDFLLVAENTQPWTGYQAIQNLEGEPGGEHNTIRHLYERSSK